MDSGSSSAQRAIDAYLPYATIAPALIGHGALHQHAVRLLDDGPVFLLAVALGAPRLWDYLLGGALDGFEDGYQRPHDGRTSTRLHQGMLVAQQIVRRRVENLIERRMSDVGLLALALDGSPPDAPVLHVLSAGPLRAYLHRPGAALRRLGPEQPSSEALLKANASWSAAPVRSNDLVLATSEYPGGDEALDALGAALLAAPMRPDQAVDTLSAPAREQRVAAAALALRVPVS